MDPRATYFGKTQHHADFVRGKGQQKLIRLLDEWLSRAMERLSYETDWKATYDNTGALDFAFVSPSNKFALIGSMRTSRDSSGRRFPFLTTSTIDNNDPNLFRCAPAAAGKSCDTLSGLADAALTGMSLDVLQEKLDHLDCALDVDNAMACDPLGNFLRGTTLAGLSTMLGGGSSTEVVARTVLAVGLVMQQLLSGRNSPIDKALELPLPARNHEAYWQVAGLWLYLITAFVRTPSMELQLIFEQDGTQPHMRVGLSGATAAPLCTAFMGQHADERGLCLIDPPWVDEHLLSHSDKGLTKLTSYLAQPDMSLEHILITFREAFLTA